MQAKITRINKRDTKADGTKLINKYDKPYYSIGIQVEGSDDWMSGFANSTQDPMYLIEEGGTYSIAVTEKKVGDRTFKNFKLLNSEEIEIENMKEELAALKAEKQVPVTQVVDEPEVDLDTF